VRAAHSSADRPAGEVPRSDACQAFTVGEHLRVVRRHRPNATEPPPARDERRLLNRLRPRGRSGKLTPVRSFQLPVPSAPSRLRIRASTAAGASPGDGGRRQIRRTFAPGGVRRCDWCQVRCARTPTGLECSLQRLRTTEVCAGSDSGRLHGSSPVRSSTFEAGSTGSVSGPPSAPPDRSSSSPAISSHASADPHRSGFDDAQTVVRLPATRR